MYGYLMRSMVLISLFFLFPGCSGQEEAPHLPDHASVQEAFLESNIYLINIEEETIDDFVERYGWNMDKSGTGLRYKIEQRGKGPKAVYGNRAIIHYDIYLLTGDPVYSSEDLGARAFTVGRGGIESGIEEGILMMRNGDKATFILPSHLAHGVAGDGNKIPRRASLVYKVELVNLF